MALSYKNDDKQDERLDPSIRDTHNDSAQKLNDLENDAFNDIAGNYDKDADNSTEESNIKKIGDREDSPLSGWQNNTTGKSSSSTKGGNKLKALFTVKGLKKTGPVGLLITIILGGGAGLLILTTPALMLQQLKETMLGKFNDQVVAMDLRTRVVLKNKLSKQTKGICTTVVSFRCKMAGVSDRQLKNLEKIGGKATVEKVYKIPGTNRNFTTKISSIELNGTVLTAENINKVARTDPAVASALARWYNPRLYAFNDKIAAKFHQKYGVTRSKTVTGETDEERRAQLARSVSGQAAAEIKAGVQQGEENCDKGPDCNGGKRKTYTDATGARVSAEEGQKAISGAQELQVKTDAAKIESETQSKIAKNTAKSFLLSSAFGLGAIDSACGGYMIIRQVGTVVKTSQAIQLMNYSNEFMKEPDIVRAQDATANGVNFFSNILTTPNDFGDSFSDSYGYRYAAYGDVSSMDSTANMGKLASTNNGGTIQLDETQADKAVAQSEVTKYINGQIISQNVMATLLSIVAKAQNANATTQAADKACGFLTGKAGQALVLGVGILGIFAAIGSGGSTLAVGLAQSVATSYIFGRAIGVLIPKIAALAKGEVITTFENGNEAGNAITSGQGVRNDLDARSRAVPALKKDDAVQYNQQRAQTEAYFAMIDRYNKSPFDTSSKNTWLGNVVFNLTPYTSKLSSFKHFSLPANLEAIAGLAAHSFGSLIPSTNAAAISEQFEVCGDADYIEMDLAADPFCNIRHGLTPTMLAIDTDEAVEYMVDNGYIDPETGEPTNAKIDDTGAFSAKQYLFGGYPNPYAGWIENCVERNVPINADNGSDNNRGKECIANNESDPAKLKMLDTFSVFYIDKSIQDGMDFGLQSSAPTVDTGATGTSNESGTLVDGDTKTLARQLLDSKNVQFQVPAQRSAMEYIAQTGKGRDCGAPAVSPNLLRVLVTASQKYKITIGVIVDGHRCNNGRHPKGLAVDMNGVAHLDQPFMLRTDFRSTERPILKEFAQYLDGISPPGQGASGGIRLGQRDCWAGDTPNIPKIKANGWFPDTCNHMHMDVNP